MIERIDASHPWVTDDAQTCPQMIFLTDFVFAFLEVQMYTMFIKIDKYSKLHCICIASMSEWPATGKEMTGNTNTSRCKA
jgi:hypothetical protein